MTAAVLSDQLAESFVRALMTDRFSVSHMFRKIGVTELLFCFCEVSKMVLSMICGSHFGITYFKKILSHKEKTNKIKCGKMTEKK